MAFSTDAMRKGIAVAVIGGLVATVVGGMILDVVPKPHDLLVNVAGGVWNGVSWVVDALVSSHLIPGWTIAGIGLLALLGLIVLVRMLKEAIQDTDENPILNYTEDILDGVGWRWRWSGNSIVNLWCFCPSCDAQLVYAQSFSTTDLICERCPSDGSFTPHEGRGRIVATVDGDRRYALAAAEREILRRIRTGERWGPVEEDQRG